MSKKTIPAKDSITASVKELSEKITTLSSKADSNIEKMDLNTKGLAKLSNEVLDLTNRTRRLEEVVATKSDINKLNGRFDDMTLQIERFDRKVLVHDKRIEKLEAAVQK